MDIHSANRKLMLKLLFVSVGMFAFGVFAMPPLYDKFCEITGIGQAGVRVSETVPAADDLVQMPGDRVVKLFLDATANSALPWEFKALERTMEVTLGKASTAVYKVSSLADVTTAGQAVYNVTPPEAARYFVKTECFCFSRQQLDASESRDMPVRFYIERDLPEDIREITLSYTFFLNTEAGDAEQLTQQSTAGAD